MKSNGRRSGKLLNQIKQFQKARDRGEDAMFFGDDFVIIDRVRFTQDVAEVVETLFAMTAEVCACGRTFFEDKKMIESQSVGFKANAIVVLAKHGKVRIMSQDGVDVVAEIL